VEITYESRRRSRVCAARESAACGDARVRAGRQSSDRTPSVGAQGTLDALPSGMRSPVVRIVPRITRIVLGSCLLLAAPAFADSKPANPNTPTDAPAPTNAPAPNAPPADTPTNTPPTNTPSTNTPTNAPTANTPTNAPTKNAPSTNAPSMNAPTTNTPAPIAKAEAKLDPLANLPARCASIAKRMATPNAGVAMTARMALAGCLADERLAPLVLLDTQESMLEVEAAIAPSFALLDDVIARADAEHQLLAHHAKMRLVQQASSRMLASVPAATQPTAEAAQLRDSRRALVEEMLAPWRAQIIDEARAANAIAKARPKLEKNAAVALALRDTKQVAPEPIASAERVQTPTAQAERAQIPASPANARPSPNPAGTAEGTLR
jgi:hypothetical protein